MDACRDLQSRPIKLLTNYDFWDDPPGIGCWTDLGSGCGQVLYSSVEAEVRRIRIVLDLCLNSIKTSKTSADHAAIVSQVKCSNVPR